MSIQYLSRQEMFCLNDGSINYQCSEKNIGIGDENHHTRKETDLPS